MSVPVSLHDLREQAGRFGPVVFLLTTSPDGRPHAVTVDLRWTDGGRLAMGAGRRTVANVAARPAVSLLWPPVEPGGYTLIVDGEAAGSDDGVTVTPTKGVLHRPATAATEPSPGCTADCVPLHPPAG